MCRCIRICCSTAPRRHGAARAGSCACRSASSCGFVFNAAFDAGRITYGRGYDNDQTFSAYFDRYVESLVAELASHVGIDGKMIAEIGCGTGYFLRRVVAAAKGSRGIGYDPSYIGAAGERGRQDRIRADHIYREDRRSRCRRRDLPARHRASARSVGTAVGSARPSQPAGGRGVRNPMRRVDPAPRGGVGLFL